jgi:uncharacterized protein (DUF58 family)
MMSADVGELSKLDHAINAALLIAYVAALQEDYVGLIAFDSELQALLPPRKGVPQVAVMADQLYGVQAQLREPDYDMAFGLLRRRTSRRALVVFFTDLVDEDTSRRVLANIRGLTPRHLPLVVTLRDPHLDELARQNPLDGPEAYERSVAIEVLGQRRLALNYLTQGGAHVLEVRAEEMAMRTVNKYLELKGRSVL